MCMYVRARVWADVVFDLIVVIAQLSRSLANHPKTYRCWHFTEMFAYAHVVIQQFFSRMVSNYFSRSLYLRRSTSSVGLRLKEPRE